MRPIDLLPYDAPLAGAWDALVRRSRNGTFLLERGFMDYHSSRFRDCSLLLLRNGAPAAVFAANYDERSATVVAHQGLTYGGLTLGDEVGGAEALQMQTLVCDHYRERLGARTLIVKPVPSLYHRYPCEEPLYALFRIGGQLVGRGLSTALPLGEPIAPSVMRRRCLRKAQRAGVDVRETSTPQGVAAFWPVLHDCLATRHGVAPVHTAEEMALLMSRFPRSIRLFMAFSPEGEALAGAWAFLCGRVLHTQYLATSEAGRRVGALDAIVHHLMTGDTPGAHWLDFGISTERQGQRLNEGLIHQKEGFGGRGICYDTYRIDL